MCDAENKGVSLLEIFNGRDTRGVKQVLKQVIITLKLQSYCGDISHVIEHMEEVCHQNKYFKMLWYVLFAVFRFDNLDTHVLTTVHPHLASEYMDTFYDRINDAIHGYYTYGTDVYEFVTREYMFFHTLKSRYYTENNVLKQ